MSAPPTAPPPVTPATRLAPSPTGALHLGNARTFVLNWVLARQRGWRVVLRIEDLDGPRVKGGADQQAIDVLRWLGLDWDEGPTYQLGDLTPYRDATARLTRLGLTYACTCTRREIEQAQSAPHDDDHELRYPGTCRDLGVRPASSDKPTALRVHAPTHPIAFDDRFAGPQQIDVAGQVGDFVIAAKNDLPAYQLAVVVDDHRQHVTEVVRGDDLLRSTGRQLWLYELLGYAPTPRYTHLPLVLGPDGRRLAKRHGDTRLVTYRDRGVPAERVLGLIAHWSGATSRRQPMSLPDLTDAFALDRCPTTPVTFTDKDDAWLAQG